MSFEGVSKVWKLSIIWMAALLLLGPLIHVLKVTRIDFEVGAIVFYVGLPMSVLLLGLGILWQRAPSQSQLLLPLIVVGLLSVFSMVMTAKYGGLLEDIAGNALRLAMVALALISFGSWGAQFRSYLMKWLPLFAFLALAVSLGSVVLIYVASFLGFAVYFGLQVMPALVSLSYGLVSNRHGYTALSLLALFGAGKRGGMMAAAAIVLGYVFIAAGKVQVHRIMAFFAAAFFVIMTAFVFGLVPEAVSARLDFLLELDEVDLNTATSGRLYEIEAALAILRDDPLVWITGQGLGSTIDAYNTSFSTIHFTPIGMLLIFGLPLTILFYGGLIAFLVLAYGYVRSARSTGEDAVFFLVILGELAFTFTAFTILQSFQLWLAIIFVAVGMKYWRSSEAYSQPYFDRSYSYSR